MKSKSIEMIIKNLLGDAISKGVFPGAIAGVFIDTPERKEKCIIGEGFTDYTKKFKVDKTTLFDLASLTKPIVTVLCMANLLDKDKISLSTSLEEIFTHSIPEDKKKITIGQLLRHSSGFPATKPYFDELKKIDNYKDRNNLILRMIMNEQLLANDNKNSVYSDIGYMLLGYIIEEITGEYLESFWVNNISDCLSLSNCLMFLPNSKGISQEKIACTENCIFTGNILCGEVHDENCRILGGIAGHAGLFGTAEGVLNICQYLLRGWKGDESCQLFSQKVLGVLFESKKDHSSWCYGFDSPSPQNSSSGRYFSKKSIGHLGFTGTSFWIDLKRELVIVLLSNRVHPSRANEKIKVFRPFFHDTIMKELLNLN
jgi:CubicO group peptidase (beta-lactamase class C family)